MSRPYVVHFREDSSVTVSVEADSIEAAREAAYNALPGSLCHQCSGHGPWSRDIGDYEAVVITDASGDEVWHRADDEGGED